MKSTWLLFAALLTNAFAVNPIEKVLSMCDDLISKLNKEAAEAERIYQDLKLNCGDRSANLRHEIEVGTSTIDELTAAIEDNAAKIESGSSSIEDLVASIAQAESELKKAKEVRAVENAAFVKREKDLVESADMLARAHTILKKEMAKGSFVQITGPNSFLKVLQTMVAAETLAINDASKLTAMLQQRSHVADDEEDSDEGAPDASVYESKSGGILETIADMQTKVEEELADARKEETTSHHNFELLQQSLTDQIKNDGEDKEAAADTINQESADKAENTGNLQKEQAQLADNKDGLSQLERKCKASAESYEDEKASRSEEIKAVTKAKKIIAETTSGATAQNYGFLQLVTSSVPTQVVHMLKNLARTQHSSSLAQLASRMQSVIRLSDSNTDVFAKVKGLITDMIAQLENDQKEAGAHAAYCAKETSQNDAKISKTQARIDALTARKDSKASRLAKLKQEVKELSKEIVTLEQQMTKSRSIRQEENTLYIQTKADNEQGIAGVQQALKVLREYYAQDAAHSKDEGASGGIISLLEVALGDFQSGLVEANTVEEKAQADFDKSIKASEIASAAAKTEKEGKEEMIQGIQSDLLDLKTELGNEYEELEALTKYRTTLKAECEVKAESYEERAAKRKAELDGLKQALEILEGASGASLVQTHTHRSLRG